MINNLHVRNLALIDEADITFTSGLNILTGETGAGKSIIIGSLGLALGCRADSDVIRAGAESALVELTITPESEAVWQELENIGVERDSDQIIIKRRLFPGRSDCRINGETVSLKELSRISSLMIDICGQRESLSLLKETALKNMLDDCGGDELHLLLNNLSSSYKEYTSILSKLDEVDEDESLRRRKADLAEYEINEIDEASLAPGEDEELESEYRKLSHSAKITESMYLISGMCGSDEGAGGLISRSLREIRSIVEYDENLSSVEDTLSDLESMCSDLSREVSSYLSSSEYDPERFSQIQSRLDLINHLKDKYGASISSILEYRDEKLAELEKFRDHDAYMEKLNADKEAVYGDLVSLCSKVHDIRCSLASVLGKNLVDALKDMNFLDCNLQVTVTADEEHISASGYDKIDFCISMNPGEPLRPLSSVASGGELSRIMLAIKCVTGDRDQIDTMVFDEIDTGISGVTSWKVGEKMSQIATSHQVICITHQSQIAAQADTHFLINKYISEGRTLTSIEPLARKDMIEELARMMGSDNASDAALSAAEDLKKRAGK